MIFLIPVTVLAAFYAGHDRRILPLIFVTLGFGLIGFIDDFIKVVKKRKDGLYWNQKMFGLLLVAVTFAVICLIPILRTSLFLLWEWIKRCRWDGCLSHCCACFDSLNECSEHYRRVGRTCSRSDFDSNCLFHHSGNDQKRVEYIKMFSAMVAGGCLGF